MIQIENLSKSFGSKVVLNQLNLEVKRGQVHGLVGKNGAGKTTLFHCIAGLETHIGHIGSEYENLKNHLGYLQTNPIFMSRITGWEYLKLFCVARNIKEDDFEAQNIFDLPLNQYAETYSTGMKKKLALMAILLQKNDVFILDEPFNGVDIQSNIVISSIIDKLKNANKIVLISSHIFSTLSDCCDQISLLEGGEVTMTVGRDQFSTIEQKMKHSVLDERVANFQIT